MQLKFISGLCLTLLFMPMTGAQAAEESFERWFQIDVIVFRPTSTNTDNESWPNKAFSYPHNVTDVGEPGPFNLSALSALTEDAAILVDDTQHQALPSNEFVFKARNRGYRTRQAVETHSTNIGSSETDGTDPELSEESTAPAAFNLDELIIPGQTEGQLAFTDPAEASTLADVSRSLNRSSRYRVLAQHSWIQPVTEESTPVIMQAGKRYDDLYEIEGTLSFSVSRYLHVDADLWYTVFEPRGAMEMTQSPSATLDLPASLISAYSDLAEVERTRGQYYPAGTHPMNQSRRMRSGELHYLDHPLFGVLLKISRYEGPAVIAE